MEIVHDDIVSNCCGAPFWYPGWPDSDICSMCMEHADVEEDEEIFRKCIECGMNTSEDKGSFISLIIWICYSCHKKKAREQNDGS